MGFRLISALLLSASGLLIFVQIYNRFILHLRQGILKTSISVVAAAVTPLAPLWFGLSHGSPGLAVMATVLALTCAIPELSQRYRRHSLKMEGTCEEMFWKHCAENRSWLRDTSDQLIIRKYSIDVPDYSGPDIRIAQMSDFHADTSRRDDFFIEAAAAVNACRPDILFLTGDFSDRIDALSPLITVLRTLKAPLGVFAVLGNHDFWNDHVEIREQLENAGVIFPSSTGEFIATGSESGIRLFGIGYPHEKPWFLGARSNGEGFLNIALSHTPDNFFRLEQSGIDLVFSGHLHGGQWRLPGIGSVVSPSIYDRVFDHGHFHRNKSHLLVTSGIGNVWIPKRINCPAEILLADVSRYSDRSIPVMRTDDIFQDRIRWPADSGIALPPGV